jgi:hypothetical protein
MVEHLREHPRLAEDAPAGHRVTLSLGKLFVPVGFHPDPQGTRMVLAFHCGTWIPEVAVSRLTQPLPILHFQLGSGSSRYAKPFEEDQTLLERLLEDVSAEIKVPVRGLILVGWSAGYGAIRELLKNPPIASRCEGVLLIDGLHASYVNGRPGPLESQIETETLQPFLDFARKAQVGERQMLILHTEIFPGTFASTTETADWLIRELKLRRQPILKWGPMKTQQVGETHSGRLQIRAFAGNSAPDHVDLLHGMPEFLSEMTAP